jgi:polyisoprenoid-binding protein YceI
VIQASRLEVSAVGEPTGDAPKVQETMGGDKVLDVAHHATIAFESTSAAVKDQRGDRLEFVVNGQLTIRDVTRPVTIPVHVELAGSTLIATGRFAIKQTAFGITPISIGGVVAVKDSLDIEFSISASRLRD